MKKGVFVFALLFVASALFAQPNSKSMSTITIDNFDSASEQNYQLWEHGKVKTYNWNWKVRKSRFAVKDDGYFDPPKFPEAIPNSLKVIRTSEGPAKVMGVRAKFQRKGDNWFEIFPTEDGEKPFEVPLEGTVSHFDFWVWGANYRYFLDVLVRDADGAVRILPAGTLAFNGWKNIILKIPGAFRQRSRFRSGPPKMTFVGFRISTDPSEFVDDFLIYFDDFKYTTYTLSNVFDGYELKDYFENEEGASESASSGDGQ